MPEASHKIKEISESLGICLGASTISLVRLKKENTGIDIFSHTEVSHGGNPRIKLQDILSDIDLSRFDHIAVTGRKFRHLLNFPSVSESEALEYAYRFVKDPDIQSPAVVSAGGETFMVYAMNPNGRISNVITGNKCASGTGEFFKQQLRRMDVSFEEALKWAAEKDPYKVSGRCSVFCKSDCTHAINKGIPKSRVTAGLCRMMSEKILSLLKKIPQKNIMIVGGTTRNQMMMNYLRQEIPGLIVPEAALYFEALGAALWALGQPAAAIPRNPGQIRQSRSFGTLPSLQEFRHQVVFNTMAKECPCPGDICIFGLDVGSTSTKAVLMRSRDHAVLASVYLLTNGDPVQAASACYREIHKQIGVVTEPAKLSITGLGVCGSGRQIAGLHALTDGIINEIIAHATAAVHFDAEVDTIFEIGGQDAKYTYISNGVPSDYAMNEACSAGTGSFLEEAAYETLNIQVEDIAAFALKGMQPPNFNDQCAAFISSDIKTAIHEGIDYHDIVAGLVYSIGMNYINRVKGNRPMGEKIFMQGGVCYNTAVPLAMAALTGKKIIVPPEPGLMGAYGAAMVVKKRMDLGLIAPKLFDLAQLAGRQVKYKAPFICGGGPEKCDRHCEINVIELEGTHHPFGGACNRYYNIRNKIHFDVQHLDRVRAREKFVFSLQTSADYQKSRKMAPKTVGINKSFLANTLYPFYHAFFNALGFHVILPASISEEGIDFRNAAFCYPAEIAHGFFHRLLQENPPPDYLFLPHIQSIPLENADFLTQACPFVQGEPFYLNTAFHPLIKRLKAQGTEVLTPFLDMQNGLAGIREAMLQMASAMGCARKKSATAWLRALSIQAACHRQIKSMGTRILQELASDPEKIAVVIFGRPYNAMVEEAHMGIPHKFASRGIQVLPLDALPFENEPSKRHMYWGMGQMILKAAHFVKKHPQLFSAYITNFSCGPDSFLISYFRSIMGRKPSLTLELDSHTADAGLETRIEAFLDIIQQYRHILHLSPPVVPTSAFQPASTYMHNGIPWVQASDGRQRPLSDPKVTLLIPSMGELSTRAISQVFSAAGYHVAPVRPANASILKLGRAHTSCKECLPLILTAGTLLDYIYHKKQPDEVVIYFMPSASGPCRFGQYAIYMEDMIQRLGLKDVAIFSLTSDNTYATMGKRFDNKKAWCAIVLADIMEDLRSLLAANAVNPDAAVSLFHEGFEAILNILTKGRFNDLRMELTWQLKKFAQIPQKKPYHEIPKILLTGEIFVRRDGFSRQKLDQYLCAEGFSVICSPVAEWFHYSDYLLTMNGTWRSMPASEKIRFFLRRIFMNRYDRHLADVFKKSGVLPAKPVDLKEIMQTAESFISEKLMGEAILTIGSAVSEIATNVCGVIAIGPFGCMPNRLSEAILSDAMTRKSKLQAAGSNGRQLEKILESMEDLPFLAIETDGSPFPQLINAKLEAFCQRSRRLHHRMMRVNPQ